MESILKRTLKRQLPYLIGGTITGTFISYYYGILFSIIVNSIVWFAISTVVNKYYWHYTGFKDELYLVSKYIVNRKKNKTKSSNIHDKNKIEHKDELIHINKSDTLSAKKTIQENKVGDDVGSPIKL